MKVLRILCGVLAAFFATPALSQFSDFESLDFHKPDSIAESYTNYDLRNQEKLTLLLTKDLNSDIDKFRAIFKWIINNISYDVNLFDEKTEKENKFKYRGKKLEKWRHRFDKRLLKRLIINRSSICYGYSSLLETMCGYAGIQCQIVEGYGRNPSERIGYGKLDHAWNVVFLNNKWSLCDATWASGYINSENNKFKRDFNKNYFLTDPSLFGANHYPKNTSWILTYDKPTLKGFLNSPIKSSGFIRNKLNHFDPEEGRISTYADSTIRFRFTSNLPIQSIKRVYLKIYKRTGKIYLYQFDQSYDLLMDKEGYYYFEHKLNDKGDYRLVYYLDRGLAPISDLTFVYEINAK